MVLNAENAFFVLNLSFCNFFHSSAQKVEIVEIVISFHNPGNKCTFSSYLWYNALLYSSLDVDRIFGNSSLADIRGIIRRYEMDFRVCGYDDTLAELLQLEKRMSAWSNSSIQQLCSDSEKTQGLACERASDKKVTSFHLEKCISCEKRIVVD